VGKRVPGFKPTNNEQEQRMANIIHSIITISGQPERVEALYLLLARTSMVARERRIKK